MYNNICVNSASDNKGCNVNEEVLIEAFTLFCFDLTPDKCNGFYYHENKTGTIDVKLLFAKPLEQAITVLCYTGFEAINAT